MALTNIQYWEAFNAAEATLKLRCAASVVKAAIAVLQESAGTGNHANRKTWAERTLSRGVVSAKEEGERAFFLGLVLSATLQNQGASISDDALDSLIFSGVNLLAGTG